MKRIASSCDHVGFILKHEIVAHLAERGVGVIDKGIWSSKRINYPHCASQIALAVTGRGADGGILICGTNVDISIAANKFTGIRAVVCSEPCSAQLSWQCNDISVLAFGSRVVSLELTKMIVDAWLGVQYESGRRQQRVEAITTVKQ